MFYLGLDATYIKLAWIASTNNDERKGLLGKGSGTIETQQKPTSLTMDSNVVLRTGISFDFHSGKQI